MSREKYTHVQVLLPEIRAMEAAGKTKREIAEHFGLRDKYVVKQLLARERRKEEKIMAGIMPRPKGRPRKDTEPRDLAAEQACPPLLCTREGDPHSFDSCENRMYFPD